MTTQNVAHEPPIRQGETLYVPRYEMAHLSDQITAADPSMGQALQAGAVTLSLDPPTASAPAVIAATVHAPVTLSLMQVMAVLRPLARDLGRGDRDIALHLAAGTVLSVPCERERRTLPAAAYDSYAVADLSAE